MRRIAVAALVVVVGLLVALFVTGVLSDQLNRHGADGDLWISGGLVAVWVLYVGLMTVYFSRRVRPAIERVRASTPDGGARALWAGEPDSEARDSRRSLNAWRVAAAVVVAEMVGVLASFYLTKALLHSGQSVVLVSLILALVNSATALASRKDATPLTPTELLLYVKDRLLWPAALPTIAKLL